MWPLLLVNSLSVAALILVQDYTYVYKPFTSNIMDDVSTVHLYCVALVTYNRQVHGGTSIVFHSPKKDGILFSHLYSTFP